MAGVLVPVWSDYENIDVPNNTTLKHIPPQLS
jgi:hypothetical protein